MNAEEYIAQGYIHARVIIEMLGKPQEHVEATLRDYVTQIEKSEKTIVARKYFADCKEANEMFSTFVELEVYFKGIQVLVGFCFDYMPSSVEIIAPEHMSFSNTITSGLLNDLQAKLHTVDMLLKKLNNENEFLRKNMDLLLRNYLTILLHDKKMTLSQLSTLIGIPEHGLNEYLEKLIKQEKIKKIGNEYSL